MRNSSSLDWLRFMHTPNDYRVSHDLAVCFIDGEFTVKRVRLEPDAAWLIPSNSNYPPIKVTKDNEFMVWGIVTYTIKKNRRKR